MESSAEKIAAAMDKRVKDLFYLSSQTTHYLNKSRFYAVYQAL